MKKVAFLMVVLAILMRTGGGVLAQEKAKAETAKQAEAPAAPIPSAEYRMGGIITHLDPASGKISIQQQKVKG
jgi:hypothetical protein